MSLGHGLSIVRNGLVFYYDQNNIQKSWKGAPATNLWTETNLNNWSKSAIVATSQLRTPFDTPAYSITDDNTSGYESIDRNVTVANDSSSYTISCMIRKTYGATSARLGFNSGFNTGGTTVAYNQRFNSDTGVASTGTVIDYGEWWYWYFTITNNGTGNTNLYCSFYPATGLYNSSDNSTATGTAIVGAFMLVAGSTAARFVDGTRSNTQALLDLTNNNTITANSLTYTSNNTFSYGGTDSLTLPNIASYDFSSEQTIEIWLKPTESDATRRNPYNQAYGGYGTWTHEPSGSFNYYYGDAGADNIPYIGHSSSFTVAQNEIACVCTTRNTSESWWYKNGATDTQYIHSYGTLAATAANIKIGTGYAGGYIGDIYAVKIYNRALTAAEVKQNFEALRGRYGI
jgi:hypothetical protein